jgi:hypothetical protein
VPAPATAARVAKTIDEMFANSPYETTTEAERALGKAFAAQCPRVNELEHHVNLSPRATYAKQTGVAFLCVWRF